MEDQALILKLSAQTDEFRKGLESAAGSMSGFIKTLYSGISPLNALATGVGALGVVMFESAKKTAEYEAALLTLSEKTGISVERLSNLKYAAEQSETSLETLAMGFKKLAVSMQESASDPTSKKGKLFEDLRIKVTDLTGSLRPADVVMSELADKLKGFTDPTQKAAIAIELFGRNGTEILPFLKDGSKGIQELTDKSRAMGNEVSTGAAEASKKFINDLSTLSTHIKAIARDIGDPLIQKLDALALAFDRAITKSGEFKKSLQDWLDRQGLDSLTRLTKLAMLLAPGLPPPPKSSPIFGPTALPPTYGPEPGPSKTQEQLNIEATMAGEAAKKLLAEMDTLITEYAGKAIKTLQQKIAAEKALDRDYSEYLAQLLWKQGSTEEKVNAEVKKYQDDRYMHGRQQEEKGGQIVSEQLKKQNEIKILYNQYDAEYYKNIRTMARLAGEDQLGQDLAVAKAIQANAKANEIIVTDAQKVQNVAIQETSSLIRGLLMGQQTDFDQVWKGAAATFIDSMLIMEFGSAKSAAAISVNMAVATAGITILVGLIAYVFGGGGHSAENTAIKQATDSFLNSIKTSLQQFEKDVLKSLSLLNQVSATKANFQKDLENIRDFTSKWQDAMSKGLTNLPGFANFNFPGGYDAFLETLGRMKDAIVYRYDLEKQLIQEVSNIIKDKLAFVKDIGQTITGVQRATMNPLEIFNAQKEDIQRLLSQVSGASGQDKIGLLGELKSAYTDLFSSAQKLFTGDKLKEWQQYVISGLQGIKGEGASTFDAMASALDTGNNLQRDANQVLAEMNATLKNMELLTPTLLQDLANVAGGGGQNAINKLLADLKKYGLEDGGIVTRPMIRMIGESGPEAVIPLSKMGQMGGGGGGGTTINQTFSISVDSMGDFTVPKAELLLKTTFRQAAENISRQGYKWPMNNSVRKF